MIGFSCIYIASCVVLVRQLETPGLVLANCVNMMARITFSLYFITQFLYKNPVSGMAPLRSALPSIFVIVAFIASYLITRASNEFFYLSNPFSAKYFLLHAAIGTASLLCTFVSFFLFEKSFLANLRSLRQTKQKIQ